MAKPVRISDAAVPLEGTKVALLPPSGRADDPDCGSTEVIRSLVTMPSGRAQPCVCMLWRFTEEELAVIAEHGLVWVSMWGETCPPVFVEPGVSGQAAEVGEPA